MKNKTNGKDVCIVRWIYDKSTSLSFLRKNNESIFVLGLPKSIPAEMNMPIITTGTKYYGTLEQRNNTTNQIIATAASDRSMILKIQKDRNAIQTLDGFKSISLFFEDTVINLPLPNVIENFDAYKKCLASVNERGALIQPSTAPAKTLDDMAVQHLQSNRDNLATPPPLPAFKRGHTSPDALEKYRRSETSSKEKGISTNLLKKLRVLETEKEELRKKLLNLTQNSYLANIITCETNVGNTESDMNATLENSYKETIQRLRTENKELLEQLRSSQDAQQAQ